MKTSSSTIRTSVVRVDASPASIMMPLAGMPRGARKQVLSLAQQDGPEPVAMRRLLGNERPASNLGRARQLGARDGAGPFLLEHAANGVSQEPAGANFSPGLAQELALHLAEA